MPALLRAVVLAVGLLAPTAAAGVAAAVVAPDVPGGIGIRLLDAPTSEAGDPRATTYIIDRLAPGAVIHRRIEVSNTTGATQPITLYPGVARIEHGAFVPGAGPAGDEPAGWTSTAPAALDLRSGEHRTVQVTVRVPADAAPGERYGVVWASHSTAPPKGHGVTVIDRVGIRLYLSIGAGAAPASKFNVDRLVAQRGADGSPSVLAEVHNTGGRALDLSGELSLSEGPGGIRAGPFPAELGVSLAPGQSAPVEIPVDKAVPDGPWQAALTLRSGLLAEKTTVTLRFPSGPGSLPATPAHRVINRALVIAAAATTTLLVIGSAFQLGRLHRLRHDTG